MAAPITVTPEPPEDPFNPTTYCLCPQARRAFVDYVHTYVDKTAEFATVQVESPSGHCPASTHQDGIAPAKTKAKKAAPADPF